MSDVMFGSVTPILPVSDLERSIGFYRDRLHFTESFRSGDPPEVAGLRHGTAEIMLARCPGPAAIFQWTSFRIAVSGVDALYEACRGAAIVHPNGALQERPWGTREFSVLDPDGICITFWEGRAASA